MVNIVSMRQKFFPIFILLALAFVSCASAPVKDPVTDALYIKQRLTRLANDIMLKASRPPKKAAIMDFVNSNGKTSQFGKILTSKFTEISVAKNLFITPTDGEVSKSLKQLGLSYNGTLDGASVRKLGDALGCDTLIFGTISDLQKGSDVDLALKMVDVKTGNIVSASSTSFFRSKQVSALLDSF
jgi:hypothetical protein